MDRNLNFRRVSHLHTKQDVETVEENVQVFGKKGPAVSPLFARGVVE